VVKNTELRIMRLGDVAGVNFKCGQVEMCRKICWCVLRADSKVRSNPKFFVRPMGLMTKVITFAASLFTPGNLITIRVVDDFMKVVSEFAGVFAWNTFACILTHEVAICKLVAVKRTPTPFS
jgi:hypothetical protein